MALAIEYHDADQVVAATVAGYARANRTVIVDEHAPLPTVACSEEGRIEVVWTQGAEPAALARTVASLTATAWDVWVLVPSERLGIAHVALRGCNVTLQPWWFEAGLVHFGRPEIP
ncbi:MAG: hypothetical protein OEO77_05780 [Acidimicrobiia bacterium]|nr:hypothetical protein [Acidimicrobiia bacterium]